MADTGTHVGHNVLDYEWHCPSCTFINKPGSFKCHVCKTPKGTATRQVKPSFSAVLDVLHHQHAEGDAIQCCGKGGSSVSALEMQYATETAIKAHNSRLKAAAAAAAASQVISGLLSSSTTVTTTTSPPTLSTSSTSTPCTSTTSLSPNLPGHSQPLNGTGTSSGLAGQKRKQRPRGSRSSSSTSASPANSASKSAKLSKSVTMNKRVKRSCNVTVDGVTVTITEIDTTLCSDSD